MRFPYHQIEDDSIEPVGSIQSHTSSTNDDSPQEDTVSSFRQLLPYWPFFSGLLQIAVGFLCTIFGVIDVFVIPVVISVDAEIGLYRYNSYGAAIWTGILLVLSGSCAVRASRKRDLKSVIQFYVVAGLSFLFCLALFIFILWCYIEIIHSSKCNEMFPFPEDDCDFKKIHKYSVIFLLSYIWCLFGCFLLFLCVINYFCPVMFGEVRLLQKLAVCWLPCCFYLPPKEAVETYNQEQSVKS